MSVKEPAEDVDEREGDENTSVDESEDDGEWPCGEQSYGGRSRSFRAGPGIGRQVVSHPRGDPIDLTGTGHAPGVAPRVVPRVAPRSCGPGPGPGRAPMRASSVPASSSSSTATATEPARAVHTTADRIALEKLLRDAASGCRDGPPDEYVCPITYLIMVDPVIATDGYSYERKAWHDFVRRESGKGGRLATLSLCCVA